MISDEYSRCSLRPPTRTFNPDGLVGTNRAAISPVTLSVAQNLNLARVIWCAGNWIFCKVWYQ